jgi:hypothetical protein
MAVRTLATMLASSLYGAKCCGACSTTVILQWYSRQLQL